MNEPTTTAPDELPCPWSVWAGHIADRSFPWGLFLVLALAFVAGHSLFSELHGYLAMLVPGWARPFLAFIVLAYTALVLHAERLKHAVSVPALALAAFCLYVMGTDAHHLLKQAGSALLVVMATAPVFALALKLAHEWRHKLERGRSLERVPVDKFYNEKGRCVRALILTVSRPDAKPGDNVEVFPSGGKVHARFTAPGHEPVELEGADLGKDIEKLNEIRPNWQQLLRAVQPHVQRDRLQSVILYGSPRSRLDDCASFLRPYLKGLEPRPLPAVDLEDFEDVHGLLKGRVQRLFESGFSPDEIAVDITGGYKIPSVAGAVFTLNQAVVCQYVQSVGSEADQKKQIAPQIYDFRWDKSLELPT